MPALKASGNGAIVNVSSNVAFNGGGPSLAYAASKGAVNTLTKALARICAPQVRVNAVCPGLIDTAWMRRTLGEEKFTQAARHVSDAALIPRIPTAEDVAAAIFWLIEGADFTTGELVSVDGGIPLSRNGNSI